MAYEEGDVPIEEIIKEILSTVGAIIGLKLESEGIK